MVETRAIVSTRRGDTTRLTRPNTRRIYVVRPDQRVPPVRLLVQPYARLLQPLRVPAMTEPMTPEQLAGFTAQASARANPLRGPALDAHAETQLERLQRVAADVGVAGVIEQRRAIILLRMIETGTYDPDCKTCQATRGQYEDPSVFMGPNHAASSRCQSGGRDHCTCDVCF